ncbi:hypothetical protein ACWD6R_40705 [Streptomyces sp. NPDC005151]
MPSVVGLLEQRELGARRRVDELREEADRIHAELAVAEQEWKEWVIARSRVGEVLSGEETVSEQTESVAGSPSVQQDAVTAARKPRSQVPVWSQGLTSSVLSADYGCMVHMLADRTRLEQGPATCQEMAEAFGMEAVPAKVEALRSKAKRLVARGWLSEPEPGRFTPANNVSVPAAGS